VTQPAARARFLLSPSPFSVHGPDRSSPQDACVTAPTATLHPGRCILWVRGGMVPPPCLIAINLCGQPLSGVCCLYTILQRDAQKPNPNQLIRKNLIRILIRFFLIRILIRFDLIRFLIQSN